MNLNEQTYRIKQMMGLLSEQSKTYGDSLTDYIYKGGNVEDYIQNLKEKNPDIVKKIEVLTSVDVRLQKIFKEIEKEIGYSLPLEWGNRDTQQNAAAGGVKNSAHLRGLALDIRFDKPQKDLIKKLITIASDKGILGIGVYNDGDVLHIDIDDTEGKGRRAWGSDKTPKSIPDWAKEEINKHLSKK